MTTDNDPVDYLYVSKRLTTEIVDQDKAARRRWRALLDMKGGPVSLGFRGLNPDYRNRYDLARRATESVRNHTGDLANPGTYVTATLNMQLCKVVVLIGFDPPNAAVAGIFADEFVPGIGRVFLALFGSLSNFAGWRRSPKMDTEMHPSDAAGLYEILSASREPHDPSVDPLHLADDRLLDSDESFEAAIGIAYRHNEPLLPTRPLEFLARVHEAQSDLKRYDDHFDVAILGAPIWLAHPKPKPIATPG